MRKERGQKKFVNLKRHNIVEGDSMEDSCLMIVEHSGRHVYVSYCTIAFQLCFH